MSIQGHKPSGYVVTEDDDGNRVERETRQCIHCQATWIYKPGSKRRYGFCLKCNGIICASPHCLAHGCGGPFDHRQEQRNHHHQ